ncbi:MAG: tetratricopeptide repeat protein [Prevotellaceae bacterium]|jgi:TolA-binding protein|nr:tetratricopeptide repeat protein [Prevotellaceae bacterium]
MFSKTLRYLLIGVLAILACQDVYGQTSRRYQSAVELYNKGLYADAQQQLMQAKRELSSTDRTMLANIDFYDVMCTVRLKQANAKTLAKQYLENYPESGRKSQVILAVALSNFDKESYREAIRWFADINQNDLTESEQGELAFKYGYSLLKTDKLDKASELLAQVKDSEKSRYADPATFYYAHIAYEQQKYATALMHFEKVKDVPEFEDIVPFYLLQIAFYQKEYDKVIIEGQKIYKNASDVRAIEIARMMAESYVHKKDYKAALEWFEKYEKQLKNPMPPADSYLMALTYFELQRFKEAFVLLAKQTITKDELGQNIAYLLGASYINTNEKQKALNAFERAYTINANKELAVDAELNYAKLMFDLNNDIKPLAAFAEKHPESTQQGEIRSILLNVYISEKRFQEVIKLVQNVVSPTDSDYANLQRAAYYNGLELYQNGKYVEASKNFTLSLDHSSYDASLSALAKYWQAETDYRMGNYVKARRDLSEYLNTAGSFSNTMEYKMAHYTLGYSYFKEEDYDNAITWFRKFTGFSGLSKSPFVADAYNRIGDCYFTQREFSEASKNYEKAYNLNLASPDYSLFQNGMAQGMAGNKSKKTDIMKRLISQYKDSPYIPAAWYELGRISMDGSQYAEATKSFDVIIKDYKQSAYYPKALVELGLIELNLDNEDKALAYYQQVVEQFPNIPEAQSALLGIKNIHMDRGTISDYFAYSAGLSGNTAETEVEKDSLIFASAERLYLQGDCERAVTALKSYLQFSDTEHSLAASYYLGDCLNKDKKYEESLEPLAYVIDQPQNEFTNDALNRYAQATWELQDYNNAAKTFGRIAQEFKDEKQATDGAIWAMRSYYLAENFPSTINAAAQLLAIEKLDAGIIREANYTKAKSLQKIGQENEALKLYEALSKDTKNAEGAEATYIIIKALFDNKEYDKVEKEVVRFSESKTPYMSWLARSFALLGDVYVERENYFQARETYKSILGGYSNKEDGILDEVQERINAIEGK